MQPQPSNQPSIETTSSPRPISVARHAPDAVSEGWDNFVAGLLTVDGMPK
jgi:hypothetical protein